MSRTTKVRHRGIYLGITSVIGIFSAVIVARGGDLSSLNPFYGVGNQTRCKVNINKTLATNDHVYRVAGGKKNVAPYYRNFSVVVPANGRETKFQMVSNKMLNLPNSAVLVATSDSTDGAVRDREGNCSGNPSEYCNSWTDTETAGAPTGRQSPSGVWTGSKFLVWGGVIVSFYNTGGIFNPVTNSWTTMTTTGAPGRRQASAAVWTGSKMVVWGGYDSAYLNDGGQYDPSTDSWTATTTTGAPSKRKGSTSVWTGAGGYMIAWGGTSSPGVETNQGGLYNPSTDVWTAMTTTGAPAARTDHTGEYVGSKLVVFGGGGAGAILNTGGQYDVGSNSWTATTTTGAPAKRYQHTSVSNLTNSDMYVWGGLSVSSTDINTGGKYNVTTNSWTAMTTTGAPLGRRIPGGAFLKPCNKVLVWGGAANTNTGGIYDPSTNTWVATPTSGAPKARSTFAAAWLGDSYLVWSGLFSDNSGGRYFPCCE